MCWLHYIFELTHYKLEGNYTTKCSSQIICKKMFSPLFHRIPNVLNWKRGDPPCFPRTYPIYSTAYLLLVSSYTSFTYIYRNPKFQIYIFSSCRPLFIFFLMVVRLPWCHANLITWICFYLLKWILLVQGSFPLSWLIRSL